LQVRIIGKQAHRFTRRILSLHGVLPYYDDASRRTPTLSLEIQFAHL
jgi:hypothetical protein